MSVHEYLIKSAAAKTKALDNHPVLEGKQKSALPDKIQAMIIKKKMQKTAARYAPDNPESRMFLPKKQELAAAGITMSDWRKLKKKHGVTARHMTNEMQQATGAPGVGKGYTALDAYIGKGAKYLKGHEKQQGYSTGTFSNRYKENRRAIRSGAAAGTLFGLLSYPGVSMMRDVGGKSGKAGKVLTSLGLGLSVGGATAGADKGYSMYKRRKKMQKTAMMTMPRQGMMPSNMMRMGKPNMGVPSYGEGGVVKHRKNGKIIRVAEAGDEAIVPLAKKRKAKRMAKAILSKLEKTAASKAQLRRAKKVISYLRGPMAPLGPLMPKQRKALLESQELIRRHEAGRRGSKNLAREALETVTGKNTMTSSSMRDAADSIATGEAIKRNPGAGIKKVTAPSGFTGERNTAARAFDKMMGRDVGVPFDPIMAGPGPNQYPQKLNAGMRRMKKNMLKRGVTPQQQTIGVTRAMEQQYRPDKIQARLSKRIK